MAHRPVAHGLSRHEMRISRLVGRFGSFALAAVSTFAVAVNTFVESFSSARLGPVILLLFLLHLVRHAAFIFPREFAFYVWLFCYVTIELLWSVDIKLAMNTLAPAAAFVLILMQFGALATYHDLRAVLFGALGGFLAGAALYTSISGFPFKYPVDFSYNAIAGMYLMGLFVVLLLSLYSRWKGLLLVVGAVLLLLIVATTSIKTNLGILLGAGAASLMYLGHFTKVLRQNAISLVVLIVVTVSAVSSNDALVERLQSGADRVALGIEVLQSRDDVQGYSGLHSRDRWLRDGLAGWVENPVFGHGVEEFRGRFGITSHSTPVDLLYNSGLIGFGLFYGIFVSIAWRLFRSRDGRSSGAGPVIFGGIVCYLFISLSATMHYSSFLAVFIGISTALLRQPPLRNAGSTASPAAAG